MIIMSTKATSAKGVQLFVQNTSSTSTWTEIKEVKSVPEIGESSEKIDATSLTSEMKEYVKDIPDYSSELQFVANSIPSAESDSNLDIIRAMDKDKTYAWKICYPQQKIMCTLNAQFSWSMGGAEVSSIQEINITLIPRSAPTWAAYTATASLSYEANTEELS